MEEGQSEGESFAWEWHNRFQLISSSVTSFLTWPLAKPLKLSQLFSPKMNCATSRGQKYHFHKGTTVVISTGKQMSCTRCWTEIGPTTESSVSPSCHILSTGQPHTGGCDFSPTGCWLNRIWGTPKVIRCPSPAKGKKQGPMEQSWRIHSHHLAGGVASVTLGPYFLFHSPPRRTDPHPVLQAKLNIMGNTTVQKIHQATS